MMLLQAIQIYSNLGMSQIEDLVNNIFSVFDRWARKYSDLLSETNSERDDPDLIKNIAVGIMIQMILCLSFYTTL